MRVTGRMLVFIIIIFGYVFFQNEFTKINFISIKSNKIKPKTSFTILQISDVHNHKFINVDSLINRIRKLKPDIIVITGDLIDRKTVDFRNVYSFIDKISQLNNKIYFVCGNHERENDNVKEFTQELVKRKVIILNNTNIVVSKGKNLVNLCGVDDFSSGHSNTDKALYNINNKNFTVLLSHEPDLAIKNKDIQCDLVLSGHTHGGQIRIPLIGSVVAPGQGYFPKYDKGLYKMNKDLLLYIDSGLGTSVYPIRMFNRSQISFINIVNK